MWKFDAQLARILISALGRLGYPLRVIWYLRGETQVHEVE